MTEHEAPPPPGDDRADPGPSTPPSPPPHRPLLRRDDDKHLAGVAGGLADHLGIDAGIIRVAFVVLSVFGGSGVLLYLVAWAVMPSPAMPQSYVERWFGESPNPITVVAVAVGVLVMLGAAEVGTVRPGTGGVGIGLALLFGGWLLFRADRRASTAPDTAADPTVPGAASTWQGFGGAGADPVSAPPPPPRLSRRPRSILGRLTVGVALAAVGAAAVLQQLGVVALEPVQYVGLALTIIGLGLVVGAWIGRAYGLIGLGFLLVPVLLVLSLGPLPLAAGFGEDTWRPATHGEVQRRYAMGIGQLALDFSQVDFTGTVTDVAVTVGVGETAITVPADVTVAVDARMRAGEVDLFGTRTVGRPFVGRLTEVDEGHGDGRLQLTIDNGVGQLTVQREGEEP